MVKPLHLRLTLWYAAILGTILFGFSLIVYQIMARGLAQATDTALLVSAHQVVDVIDFEDGRPQLQAFPATSSALSVADNEIWLRIVDRHGRLLDGVGRYRNVPIPHALVAAAQENRAEFATMTGTGDTGDIRIYSVPFPDGDDHFVGSLQVGQSLRTNDHILTQLLLSLSIGTSFALVVACLSGMFLAKRALAPINEITNTMEQIKAHDLTRRLTLDLPDDVVGRLARMFNQMLAQLESAFQRQRQFTADAAHEFRTPLAVMKNEIGVALNHPRSRAEYQRVLGVLEGQIDRLTRLTADLLLLARGDRQEETPTYESIDLSDLLHMIAQETQGMAQTKDIVCTTSIDPALHILGDFDQLTRLFMNLLDNAIRYTPNGGLIHIVAQRIDGKSGGKQQCSVAIHDTGEGIAPEHLPHIFQRFYRGDIARSRAAGGTGLGLAIVRQIIDAHDGMIAVQSSVGQGSVFTVTFTLATRSVNTPAQDTVAQSTHKGLLPVASP